MDKENKQFVKFIAILCFFIGVMILAYLINFYSLPVSKNAADWGALGDYFGGLLNPVISALTLIFVGKTYLAQKSELSRSAEAARAADDRSQQMLEAQLSMAASYLEQIKIANKSNKITVLTTKMEYVKNNIKNYEAEILRIQSRDPICNFFMGIDGGNYIGTEVDTYMHSILSSIEDKKRELGVITRKLENTYML